MALLGTRAGRGTRRWRCHGSSVRLSLVAVLIVGLLFFAWPRDAHAADLALTLTDSKDPVRVGETYTYDLTVKNTAAQSVSGVRITMPVPEGASFVGAHSWCAEANGTVTCDYAGGGALGSNSSYIFPVTVRAERPGTISGSASTNGGVTAGQATTVEDKSWLSLAVTDEKDPVRVGETYTYGLTVKNVYAQSIGRVGLLHVGGHSVPTPPQPPPL